MMDSTGQKLENVRRDVSQLTEELKEAKAELNSYLLFIFKRDIEVQY
jgi:hypothetical protein